MKKYDIFITIKSTKNDNVITVPILITISANSLEEARTLIENRCFNVISIDRIKEI